MNRNIPIVVVASAVSILSSWAVLAEDAPNTKMPRNASRTNNAAVQGQDGMNAAGQGNNALNRSGAGWADPAQSGRVRSDSAISSQGGTNYPGDAQADNSARNVRDRNDQSLTPLDQGSSQADMDTTAQIRKEIVAGENMSVHAKNVKIITRDGQVTLRGPVNSAEEKRIIGEIAERIAKTDNVDNQLEVRGQTVSSN